MSDDVAWYNNKTMCAVKGFVSKCMLQVASWIAYIISAVVSLTAGKIQDILKPKLIEYKVPEYLYTSFSLYAAIFIVLGFINTKVIKKIIEMEEKKKSDEITDDERADVKNLRSLKHEHKAELARLNALLLSKDKIITAMHEEKGVQAQVDYYNSVGLAETYGRPPKGNNSDYNVQKEH